MIRACALVVLLAVPAWAVKNSALVEMVNGQLRDPRDLCATLACDGTTDEGSAATTRAALLPASMVIPPGKVIGLGASGFTAPEGAEITCGENAGFLALGKSCQGDSRYNGSACTTSADCLGGGTCTGVQFAPSGGTRYVMVGAASNTKRVTLIGCKLWTNQLDPNGAYTCSAGTNAGRACKHECTGFPGAACDTNGDCTGFGTCSNLTDCETASPTPGDCTGESGSPSGPGIIDAIDFSTVTTVLVRDNEVIDHKRGRSLVLKNGAAENFDNTSVVFAFPLGGLAAFGTVTYALEAGVRIINTGRLTESAVRGTTYAVLLEGSGAKMVGGTATANQSGGIAVRSAGGGQRVMGVTTSANAVNVQLAGGNANVADLICSGSDPKGTLGVEVQAGGQYNWWGGNCPVFVPAYVGVFGGNINIDVGRLGFGCGPKVVAQSFGVRLNHLYDAWGQPAASACGYCAGGSAVRTVCDVADDCPSGSCSSGTCSGGSRNGLACDCPSSTCTPFPALMAGSWKDKTLPTAHAEFRNLLLHSDSTLSSLFAFGPTRKTCTGGSKYYEACTTSNTTDCPHMCGGTALNAGTQCSASTTCTCDSNDDCPGSTCSSVPGPGTCVAGTACGGPTVTLGPGMVVSSTGGVCSAQSHSDLRISDVQLLNNQTGTKGFDFSNLSADQTCVNCSINGAELALSGASSVGMVCPSSASSLVNLQVRDLLFGSGVADKLSGCGPFMAGFRNVGPLDADDDQASFVTYTNDDGSTLNAGEVVELSTATANAVKKATAGSKVPIGCVVASASNGTPVVVAIGGTQTCRFTDVATTRGGRMRVSSTAGYFEAAASSDYSTAIAQEVSTDQGSYQTARVTFSPSSGTSLGAAPILRTATATPGTAHATTATAYTVYNFAATTLTGSKTATVRFNIMDTDTGGGVEQMTWTAYRATTSCPTVGTTTVPTGTLLDGVYVVEASGSAANVNVASSLEFIDTATVSGTNNYCLVGSRTGGTQGHTLDNVTVVVTEYQ